MKRTIVIILAVTLTLALFAGCGKESVEGEYVLKSYNGKPIEEFIKEVMSPDEIKKYYEEVGVNSAEELITLDLKSDGTALVAGELWKNPVDGTWKQDENKVLVYLEEVPLEFTLNGKELNFKDDQWEFVLVKK